MAFGLLVYSSLGGSYNEGDYVQSLAAEQFLPGSDVLINREKLDSYEGPPVKVIMNGWFMHEPENWPPSELIEPLFLSFHINRPYAQRMLTPESVDYMRKWGPIGCRDFATARMLEERGVEAYYSGCLTTTLGMSFQRQSPTDGEVLLVDLFHAVPTLGEFVRQPLRYQASSLVRGNLLRSLARTKLAASLERRIAATGPGEIISLTNRKPAQIDHRERLELARETLRRYASAKLVLTSRIHCALPCLAIGTPVIFVKYGQTSPSNMMRFKGILDLMNVVDLDGDMADYGFESNFLEMDDIDFDNPPPNPQKHLELASSLAARCRAFVEG